MRVTLVNAQVLDGNNVVPPLGLMYIAAVLEKAGHAVQIFDADPEYQDDMLAKIKEFKPVDRAQLPDRCISEGF